MTNDTNEQLEKERDYYKRHADELAGEAVKRDYMLSTLRYALKQKRQGLTLLSELQQCIGSSQTLAEIFHNAIAGMTATLGMDAAVVLMEAEGAGIYRAHDWVGLPLEPEAKLRAARIVIEAAWARSGMALLVNKATEPTPLIKELRAIFNLPYFVMLPVVISGEPAGLLLTGRQTEQRPFAPPLDSGDVDTVQAIAALIAAFVHNRQAAALREDNEMLRYLATVDKLTGIPNRRRFEEVMHQEWRRGARRGSPLSLFLIDVDHFKSWNDAYGHAAGDAVLQQVAQRVTQGLRPGDLGARYGGEEFVVILPETGSEGAYVVAERVRQSIESSPFRFEAINSTITVSIGVATAIPDYAGDPAQLTAAADQALYAAKDAGRNRVMVAG